MAWADAPMVRARMAAAVRCGHRATNHRHVSDASVSI
jgi:hypothetical protein